MTARHDGTVHVVGIGLSGRATVADVTGLWRDAADHLGLHPDDVLEVRTLDRHTGDTALVRLAADLCCPVRGLPAEELAGEVVPCPSARVAAATGTPSVAEAAAVHGGGTLVLPKTVRGGATLAVARHADLDHHGDAEARRPGTTLDLAVNVAVDAPPPFVREAVERSVAGLATYPDAAPTTAYVAAHLGVPPESVLLTNGGAEVFMLVAHARTWRHPVVVHPQFTEPEAALRAAGVTVRRHVLPPPYRLDPAALHAGHGAADLVVVGNPTNPTSVLHRRADVLACRPENGLLLVDEAFVDTCTDPRQSLLPDAARPGSRTVVLRSLTKTFGLAGLRCGLAVGDPTVVRRLAALQPHWAVSTPALAATRACLTPEGDAFAQVQRARLVANAHHLAGRLDALGLSTTRPEAPFVLATGPEVPALRAVLGDRGVATRTCASFPGLDATSVRLAARDPHVVDPVLALVQEAGPAGTTEKEPSA